MRNMPERTEFFIFAGEYAKNNPGQREGQALFNALHYFSPVAADMIHGTELDPFYNDSRVPDCIDAILALLCL